MIVTMQGFDARVRRGKVPDFDGEIVAAAREDGALDIERHVANGASVTLQRPLHASLLIVPHTDRRILAR